MQGGGIMSQYTISIDEMLKIVIQTIEQYSNYDNNAILPKKTIADVKKQVEMLNEKSINIIDNQTKEKEKQLKLIQTELSKIKKDKSKQDKECFALEKSQKEEINIISRDCEKKINEIYKALNLEKENINKEVYEKEKLEKENLEYFLNDYKENEKRLSFMNQSSKDSYNSCIEIYNKKLDDKLKKIDDDYSKLYILYDKNTKSLVKKYEKQIDDFTIEYQNKAKEKDEYNKNIKKEERDDAIKINDEIRPFYDEKNKKIENKRQQYQTKQNQLNIEKENEKQKLHNETNKITKDFIYDIKEIDSEIEELTQKFNTQKNEKINSTLYLILNDHKKVEADVKKLIEEIDENNNLRIKKLIKIKYKAFAAKKYKHEKKLNIDLRNLELEYVKKVEERNLKRKKLEFIKNKEIKEYLESENCLNKIYQEKNNIYEYDLKCDEKQYKITYDISSSSKKRDHSHFQSEKKKISKAKVAEFDIALEEIDFQKKNTNINLNLTKALNTNVHEYEDNIYHKNKNFYTVYNMLEIEKNKTILDYNNNIYEQKLIAAKKELDYNNNLTNLKNKHFAVEMDKNHKINIEKENTKIINYQFDRDKAKLKSSITIENKKLENDHLNEKNKCLFIQKLYYEDYASIINYTSSFYLLFKEGYSTIVSIYNIIYSSVESKNENIFELRNFFISIKNAFIEYYKAISKHYTDLIRELVHDREKNIKELYYNDEIISLKAKKQEKIDQFKKCISKDNEQKEKFEDEITQQKKKIYSLENIKQVEHSFKSILSKIKIKRDKIEINKIILSKNKEIKYLESRIIKHNKNIDNANNDYKERLKLIDEKIKKEIKSYSNLYDDISENISGLFIKTEGYLNKPNKNEPSTYFIYIENQLNKSYDLVNQEFSKLYLSINDFKLKRYNELQIKDKKLKYLIQYKNLIKSFNDNKKRNILNDEYKKKLNDNKNKIHACEVEYEKNKLNSKNELNNMQSEYNKTIRELKNNIIKEGQTLYDSLYAITANMYYIENDFHYSKGDQKNPNKNEKSLADIFNETENNLIEENRKNKDELEKKLRNYKDNKQQEVIGEINKANQNKKEIDKETAAQLEKYKKQANENENNRKNLINESENKNKETEKLRNKAIKALDNECKFLIKKETKNYRVMLKKKEKAILKKKYI